MIPLQLPARTHHPANSPSADGFSFGNIMRHLLSAAFGLALLFSPPALPATEALHLGLSAVVIGEQQTTIANWEKYLSRKLQRPVNFVQRRSYQKFLELLNEGKMEAGWIDGSQYLADRASLRLLAVAVWHGKPAYQACLIVPDYDTATRSIADLRGMMFGYTDPDSTSGHLIPVSEIQRLHAAPEAFFSKTLYTRSHTKLVRAVAAGLVHGAYVDCYIYERMRQYYPELIEATRLVLKSDEYGFPPIVARANLPQADFIALQDALLGMNRDEEGKSLLKDLGLDRFEAGNEHLYITTTELLRSISANKGSHDRQD